MIDLHVHTKYSLLDSISEPEELIKRTSLMGRKAICITEHGNLYSSIEVYKLCQKYGIKYLHGCEMYICENVQEKNKGSKYNHLILISKNEIGRLNLIKLVSCSNFYKYYGKPRIDFEMLRKYKEGLIVLSACMAGEIQRALMADDFETAANIAMKYKNEFGDDYYLEYQSHRDEQQQNLNRKIVDLANKLEIKYVVTTDSHYVNKEDQKYHNVFVQIGQSREAGETYNDCYLQTDEEILEICKSTTREENLTAMKNTEEIADKCNVKIPLSHPIMTHIEIPNQFRTEIEYLRYLCELGLEERKINFLSPQLKKKYIERMNYELEIIEKMGFEGYYLLVRDYATSVRRRGIARGSGGGSLVAYLIKIVDIDPIKYVLYFERFIDVGALKLLEEGKITKFQLKIPDYDLDFGKEDRNRVIENIIMKHGRNRFASLGAFQYNWAKGTIKDIGKVLGIPFEITNEMTKKLGNENIKEALDLGLLDDYKEKYPELFEYAEKLAGLPKSFSVHPCGKLLTMRDVDYYNATEIDEEGFAVLQGDMHTAEDLGLVKFDVLGLRTVDVVYDVLDMIGKDYDYIAPHNIDFNDKLVLENFRNGHTAGIFQFESNGMRETLKNIEASSLYDLSVANALFRPGSMDYIENYANRRKGIEKIEYIHDDLKQFLADSYGIIIFQEQLIEIGRMAGLSNPDELRKATAKKDEKLMAKIKPELFEGLKKRGWNEDQLEQLWEVMIKFAKYSFNKSHAYAYAIIAYICMYLKTYHPKEFIVAWINSYEGKTEKIGKCVEEARRLGIQIKVPKWREITGLATLREDQVYIGSISIKNCNAYMADELKTLSMNQYSNFYELLKDINEKTSINSKQLDILIQLDLFSEFGNPKKLIQMVKIYNKYSNAKVLNKAKVDNYEAEIIQKYSRETKTQYRGLNNEKIMNELTNLIVDEDLSVRERIMAEQEYLGYVNYTNPNMDKRYVMVFDLDTQYSPKFTGYCLNNGKSMEIKVFRQPKGKRLPNIKTYYKDAPFSNYDILYINKFESKTKSRKVEDKYEPIPGSKEWWAVDYVVALGKQKERRMNQYYEC